MEKLIEQVKRWFVERKLDVGNGRGQLKKLQEEVNELVDAHYMHNTKERIDAVGDITVVLIGYCLQTGLDFEGCLNVAYNEIKNRKGQVVNGIFVKEIADEN